MEEKRNVLSIEHLSISFSRYERGFRRTNLNAIRDLSLTVGEGEMVAVVGASGSGKSLLAHAVLGILPYNASWSGTMTYRGEMLTEKRMKALRGKEIVLVPQSVSYLDPLMRVGEQVRNGKQDGESRKKSLEVLGRYGLDEKTERLFPFQLSGGMTRRILISTAVMETPRLVIADEPTTALDVTVQKQVIDLLNKLQKELGFAMVFVSHDLALVAEVANSITVMYAGQVVEQGPVSDILCHPVHEYTRGLLGSVLSIEAGGTRLHQVPGSVPSPKDFPEGDRFTPRSSHPDKVSQLRPVLKRVSDSDHYYAELPDSELKRLGIKPYVPGGAII